jgi:predicted ArsR family transcriptional regulator
MRKKEQRQRAIEEQALSVLKSESDWLTAHQVAEHIGAPWRAVARALLRLAAAGRAVLQHSVWRDNRSRPRRRWEYRVESTMTVDVQVWPAWMR